MLFKNISRARQRKREKPCPFGRVNIPNAALKSSLFADARCAPPSLFTYSLFPCLSYHSSETSLITTDSSAAADDGRVSCFFFFFFILECSNEGERILFTSTETLEVLFFVSPITTLPKVGRTWLLVHDAFECILEGYSIESKIIKKARLVFVVLVKYLTIWLNEVELKLFWIAIADECALRSRRIAS